MAYYITNDAGTYFIDFDGTKNNWGTKPNAAEYDTAQDALDVINDAEETWGAMSKIVGHIVDESDNLAAGSSPN